MLPDHFPFNVFPFLFRYEAPLLSVCPLLFMLHYLFIVPSFAVKHLIGQQAKNTFNLPQCKIFLLSLLTSSVYSGEKPRVKHSH